MDLRHDANDANLSRIADDIIGVREAIDKKFITPRTPFFRMANPSRDSLRP